MATIIIRNFDDEIMHLLKVQAATNGRSMEAEARMLLTAAIGRDPVGRLSQEQLDALHRRLISSIRAEERSISVEEARCQYKLEHIKFLMIAEAPPRTGSHRFFYFSNVQTGDSLFIETMKVFYPACCGFDESIGGWRPGFSAIGLRAKKEAYLRRFQNDGWYLMDAVDTPMPDSTSASQKKRIIRASLPALKQKLLNVLPNRERPIILIGEPVFAECARSLREDGFAVLNKESIDIPALGRAKLFRKKLRRLLEENEIKPSDCD